MSKGYIVIGGTDKIDNIKETIKETELDILAVDNFHQQRDKLETKPPVCFLVDTEKRIGQEICLGVRMAPSIANLPIVSLVHNPWSGQVCDAFAMGADDYVPLFELNAIKAKLFTLLNPSGASGQFIAGKVLIADHDRQRRMHFARYLKNMGMDVTFAIDSESILEDPKIKDDPQIKLFVASWDLGPDSATATMMKLRSIQKIKTPWVIFGHKDQMEEGRALLKDQQWLHFFTLDTDPAQIVFVANQLIAGAGPKMRRSPRIGYESTIICDLLSGGHKLWGYIYNINQGGLYVRTLTPPVLGTEVSLEFTPPHGRGVVKVDAQIVWRQQYSGSRGYPSGFGVQYVQNKMPVADGAALIAGYNKLLEDSGVSND